MYGAQASYLQTRGQRCDINSAWSIWAKDKPDFAEDSAAGGTNFHEGPLRSCRNFGIFLILFPSKTRCLRFFKLCNESGIHSILFC